MSEWDDHDSGGKTLAWKAKRGMFRLRVIGHIREIEGRLGVLVTMSMVLRSLLRYITSERSIPNDFDFHHP